MDLENYVVAMGEKNRRQLRVQNTSSKLEFSWDAPWPGTPIPKKTWQTHIQGKPRETPMKNLASVSKIDITCKQIKKLRIVG